MARTFTARGTNYAGSTDDTITLPSTTFIAGSSALIFVQAGDTASDPSDVTWGTGVHAESAVKIGNIANVTGDVAVSVWYIQYIRYTDDQTITANWSATNKERIIMAVQLTECTVLEVSVSASQDASTAPSTGTAGTSSVANTLQIAYYGHGGKDTDSVGIVGDGHTDWYVQVGGNGFAGNLSYEILTAIGDVRGSRTGAKANNWASIVVSFKSRQTFELISVTQRHHHRNHLPDYIEVVMEDEAGIGRTFEIDPDIYDSWTEDEFTAYIWKIGSIWAQNNLDSDLTWEDNATRNTRMASQVGHTVVV